MGAMMETEKSGIKEWKESDWGGIALKSVSSTTLSREVYFIEFANMIRAQTKIPIMLTGGLRSRDSMVEAISKGIIDFVGIARPLSMDPDFCSNLLSNKIERIILPEVGTGIKSFDGGLQNLWYQRQMHRMSTGLDPDPNQGIIYCLTVMMTRTYISTNDTKVLFSLCLTLCVVVFTLKVLFF